jgi:hypothetical protein
MLVEWLKVRALSSNTSTEEKKEKEKEKNLYANVHVSFDHNHPNWKNSNILQQMSKLINYSTSTKWVTN